MPFTLAHLSDPHLAPLPQPRWSELMSKRVTGYINWRRNRRFVHDAAVLAKIVADLTAQKPDHIACTGDLANIALPDEFVRGRDWLEALGSPRAVSLVPGNHDAYVREGLGFAGRQWGAYMSGDDGKAGFPYLRRRSPLALIGVSSAVPTAWGLATGWVGATQLTALSELLHALKREPLFRVVLIHHPPVSEAKRHKLLLDRDLFKRVIAEHGAELVLHGHDHLHMLNWLDGPHGTRVPAVGVPSASAAPGKARNAAAYNLYAIDGAPGGWRCAMMSRGIDAGGAVTEQKRAMLVG
jgi:3',5'-cyclic AMP phosphodiesterase CpdA